jgi:beta-mannosidase
LITKLWHEQDIISRQVITFAQEKEMHLPDPQLSTEINPLGDKLEINISAKALARFISLNLPGKDVIFSDNFFDLPAGRSIQITCPNPDGWSIEQVHQALQIRSLANIIPAQPKIADDIKYYWIGLKPGNIINRILFSLIK